MIEAILLFFWFCHIQQRIFYFLYFWQLKEYRLDRFLEEAGRKKSFVFSKIFFLTFLFLLVLLFLDTDFPRLYLVALFYCFLGSYSLFLFIAKKWKLPKFTKKMSALYVFCLFSLLFLVLYFIKFEFILFLLIFEILFPLFIFICVEFIQIPSALIKRQIFKRAKEKRGKFKDLIVVGITGSYGKTSTKEFLYRILSQKYNTLKTQGNNNTEMGVANTILHKLKSEHQIFICEMGAYKTGEIKTICNIVKPKIGILTGVNEQHLALFGNQENIVKAKFELIESLPDNGIAVLNGDCEKIQNPKSQIPNKFKSNPAGSPPLRGVHQNSKFKIRFFSAEKKCDVWAEDIEVGRDNVKFEARAKDRDSARFEVNILGARAVLNVLGACACAKELGISLGDCARACARAKPLPGSGVLVKTKQGFNIIDAAYSANPDSVMSHLDYLKVWKGRKAIVMPCLIELGSAFKDVHQKIGKEIGRTCDLAIITKKECYEIIKNSAMQSGMSERNILFIQKPKEIYNKLKNFNGQEDVILLESRVPKELIDMLEV